MKKGTRIILSLGLICAISAPSYGARESVFFSKPKFACLVAGLSLTACYYKFCVTPRVVPKELSKDATQLEKIVYYVRETLGHPSKKEGHIPAKGGKLIPHKIPAKNLGIVYDYVCSLVEICKIPASLLLVEFYVQKLTAQ